MNRRALMAGLGYVVVSAALPRPAKAMWMSEHEKPGATLFVTYVPYDHGMPQTSEGIEIINQRVVRPDTRYR